MKILSLIIGFFAIIIYKPLLDLTSLVDNQSVGVELKNLNLEHSSDNCRVESVKSINSKADGKIYIITIFKNKMNFSVTNKSYTNNHFYVNSNFFGKQGEPLGETKVKNKIVSNRVHGGGFFYTDGLNGHVSISSRPKSTYSSQTGYVSIRNGVINNSYNNSPWGKLSTDRILIGENINGDIVVIHTGIFGGTTIKNMNRVANKMGLVNAIHLDGGSSVQVRLKDGFYTHEFKALSDFGRKFTSIPEPPVHIIGNFK